MTRSSFFFFSNWFSYKQGLIYSWIHGSDPIDQLQVTKYLERFHQEMKTNPKLLQETVEKYFLVSTFGGIRLNHRIFFSFLQKNNHKLITTMNIDEEYAEKKKEREAELCQKLIAKCEDKQTVYRKGKISRKIYSIREKRLK